MNSFLLHTRASSRSTMFCGSSRFGVISLLLLPLLPRKLGVFRFDFVLRRSFEESRMYDCRVISPVRRTKQSDQFVVHAHTYMIDSAIRHTWYTCDAHPYHPDLSFVVGKRS